MAGSRVGGKAFVALGTAVTVALIGALVAPADAGPVAEVRPDAKVTGPVVERLASEGSPQPLLSFPGFGEEIGDDIYADIGPQTVSAAIEVGGKTKVRFRVENDGATVDSFRLKAIPALVGGGPGRLAAQKAGDFKVRYRRSGKNVTEKISDGRLKLRNVAPGAHGRAIVAKVKHKGTLVERPFQLSILFSATSVDDPLVFDVAGAQIRVGSIRR